MPDIHADVQKTTGPSSTHTTFPTFLLTCSLVFNVLIFLWIGVHAFNAYTTMRHMADSELHVTTLKGTIIHLDEVLTMSARMASVTGELSWEARYNHYQHILDDSIQEIIRLAPEPRLQPLLQQTDSANQKLEVMEKTAFGFVHEGKLDQAQKILFSPEYETQKNLYSQGMVQYTTALQQHIEQSINEQKINTYHIIVFTSIVVFMLTCAWILALKAIHRWRFTVEHARQTAEQAKEQLQVTLSELEQTNIELERFAYIASHDLQEPLRTVSAFVQLLVNSNEMQRSDEMNDYIRHIEEAIQRMRALTGDLLAYSQLTDKSRGFLPVDCNAILQHTLKTLAAASRQKAAIVTYDPLPIVIGEKTQLAQLFQNILSNAFKYSSPDIPPKLHITAAQEGNYWHFIFSDNGIGIEEEHLEAIFSLFTRLHTMRQFAGTGIGLAICKKVVETHGGRIWAESVPGKGSSFHFTLPVSA